ncbi:hypothetical protein JOD43_000772 [Pullulanibacillus pueri]|uniref:Uncharacterized protein n=1 Tax=Pullulanibacillus pueri TaxID=1437324 RepID=A0A8J2ZWR4_9BACL|nr:hypothetical protein [Pullulanibacillus pueri]MBM7680610.1 hypothetical protein [Pullulanibacillus pueri]GGH83947.1 hypothetical protein GCM10007096_25890 [Pullulanibacillus pueri]
MGNMHKPRNIKHASNSLQDECIRVPKVYDWVTDTLTVTKTIPFTEEQLEEIECAMDDPDRRPLRLISRTPKTPPLFPLNQSNPKLYENNGFFCEQIGEKRNVTVPVAGDFVDAQLVDLLFNTDVKIEVVDRHGEAVTECVIDVAAMESFVLCFPDGTDLLCRISRIFSRISSGTILLNNPAPTSFKLEVTFCVDVQVEAEVKLEVLAKFCDPRENNIVAPENEVTPCPPVTFPEQCPSIFPAKGCECQASGEATGVTSEEATEQGQVGILVDICPDCSLVNSTFEFTFDDRDRGDGLRNLTFIADSFDPETLECKDVKGGTKLIASGDGHTDDGRHFDFNLALVDSKFGSQFQVQLIHERTGKVIFDTGVVDAGECTLSIQDCVDFDDLKFKV